MSLPVAAMASPTERPVLAGSALPARQRVLLVEDNAINRELFTDLLEAHGFVVLPASDAETAIALAHSAALDLILMDVALPGRDGLEVTLELKRDPATRAIPIVALTAHAMKGDAERAYAAGCVGYITKPINTRAFPRVVRGHCEQARRETLTAATTAIVMDEKATERKHSHNKMLPDDVGLLPLPQPTDAIAAPVSQTRDTNNVVPVLPPPTNNNARARKRAPMTFAHTTETPQRVLVVDDDAMNREVMGEMLGTLRYEAVFANSGSEALGLISESIDLILMDVMMPDGNGCDVVRHIRNEMHVLDLPIIMVTALSNREERLRAVEAGANDFITKPVDRTELHIRMASLLKLKAAQDALKQHQRDLENVVRMRTADLCKAVRQLTFTQEQAHQAQLDTMRRMALAAEFRDDASAAAHICCIGQYCAAIARALEMSPHAVETVLHAGPIHDIGLLGVPESILGKRMPLTSDEEEVLRRHTTIGARILSGSTAELLRAGEVIAASHHEHWDGGGYPRGLRGDDIPLFGRICAVADAFDNLTAYRPDLPALDKVEALKRMEAERGRIYDPRVLGAFTNVFEEICGFHARFRRGEAPPPGLATESPYAFATTAAAVQSAHPVATTTMAI